MKESMTEKMQSALTSVKEKLEELNLSKHLFLNASDYLYFTKND